MSQHLLRRAIRGAVVALCLLGGMSMAAPAQVRFGIGVGVALPGLRIGVNIPAYPDLVPVPGYPVYYAPQLDVNLFFYDGLYWLFANDQWYSSTWYNGPWYLVPPYEVPDFILRVPVQFYQRPPLFFRYWNRYDAPRWGEHWGPSWRRRRPDWDRWNRRAVPPRAPLPRYQRDYPRGRYPGPRERRALENRYYRRVPQRARPGMRPGEQRMRPGEQRMRPGEQRMRPGEQRMRPGEQRMPQRSQQQRRERPMPRQRSQQQRRERPRPSQRSQQQRRERPRPSQRSQQQRRDRAREHRPGDHPPG